MRWVEAHSLLAGAPGAWDSEASVLLLNPRTPGGEIRQVGALQLPDLPAHVWLRTSGSSGGWRLVALSRRAILASAAAVNRHLQAGPGEDWINPLPLFHVGGLAITARAHLAGARVVSLPRWDPQEFFALAERHRAVWSSLVPAQVFDLVQAGVPGPGGLRGVIVGGGALDAALHRRALDLGWPVRTSYGLTECASQVATARVGDPPGADLPVLDHVEVRTGRDGVLELRSEALLTGWCDLAADGSARWVPRESGAWFTTSDRVHLEGRLLRFESRGDLVVKVLGEQVDVGRLEQRLSALLPEASRQAVALAVTKEPRRGHLLHPVVEAGHEGCLRAALARWEGAPFERLQPPVIVRRLSRSELGKVLRAELANCVEGRA